MKRAELWAWVWKNANLVTLFNRQRVWVCKESIQYQTYLYRDTGYWSKEESFWMSFCLWQNSPLLCGLSTAACWLSSRSLLSIGGLLFRFILSKIVGLPGAAGSVTLGIPVGLLSPSTPCTKSLLIWVSPSHITLVFWVSPGKGIHPDDT